MSYQVLARKWRPRSFAELVGQTHVLQALVNALDQDRLHHAYLFTGTRGVGKTTIARIFAKCLNCEQGVSATPCGKCSACQEINDGRFVDLIEVDAASRTKVEDTRELLDNVQYAPTRGRYKVYLIDEVHMLSTHSFNALLKTLEEPPPHVKFLLATTDPQKLPVTILSRCLQFSLKNMTPERIVGHLETVLGHEHVEYDAPALWQLALSADGSMRDALSLTDQAIAFGNGCICESDVSAMLGTIDKGQVMRMVRALATANAADIIAAVGELAEFSPDYLAVLDDMLSVLHRIAVAQAVPDAVDNSQGDREQVIELATAMRAEDVQLYYQVGLVGKKDLPLAPDPRSGFEMAMLRMMAFRPDAAPVVDNSPMQTGAGREASDACEKAASVPPTSDPEPDPTAVTPTVAGHKQPPVADPPVQPDEPVIHHQPDREEIPLAAYDEPVAVDYETVDVAVTQEPPPSPVIPQSADLVTMPADAAPVSGVVLPDVYIDEGKALSLSELDAASWIAVFRSLSMGGVTGNIGSHCEYTRHDEGTLKLRLDAGWSTLYSEMHRERIEGVLSDYFNTPLKLQVEIGQIETETPARWRQRKVALRLQQAKQSIHEDPVVQMFVNQFSGAVLEQTIEPVGHLIN